MKNSGYDHELTYNPQPRKPNRQRSRNVIWFNPPFNANVSTNIGRRFLAIIDECFPQNHPLRKICNRNTLKLSYSCMPNAASIISSHNKAILTKHTNTKPTVCDTCSCRRRMSCPLDGKCLTEGVVYQATVKREDTGDIQTYVGITEGSFKSRYNNHTSTFRNPKRKHSTALSRYIWNLKNTNANFLLKWKIIKCCKAYSSRTRRCNLCLYEKFFIIRHPKMVH